MISGSIVALITPFNRSGDIDFVALENLIRWHIEEGSDGLVLCGSTGEGSSLFSEEKCAIFEKAVSIGKGRIPLIANTGTNQTKESVALTQEAKKMGMDGCLAIVPYYNRPTEEGCYCHFAEIATVGLPMIIYHHPGRTALSLSVKAFEKICSIPQVGAIKEVSGDFHLTAELIQMRTPLFSGNDDLALPFLSLGGAGTISIIGNVVPGRWKHFVDLALKKEIEAARKEFFELYDLCKALVLETNPQCVKYALSLMGKCEPYLRLPLLEPKGENQEKIRKVLPALITT